MMPLLAASPASRPAPLPLGPPEDAAMEAAADRPGFSDEALPVPIVFDEVRWSHGELG